MDDALKRRIRRVFSLEFFCLLFVGGHFLFLLFDRTDETRGAENGQQARPEFADTAVYRIPKYESSTVVTAAFQPYSLRFPISLPNGTVPAEYDLLAKSCSCFEARLEAGKPGESHCVFEVRLPLERQKLQVAASFEQRTTHPNRVEVSAAVEVFPRFSVIPVRSQIIRFSSNESRRELSMTVIHATDALAGESNESIEIESASSLISILGKHRKFSEHGGIRVEEMELKLSLAPVRNDVRGDRGHVKAKSIVVVAGDLRLEKTFYWTFDDDVFTSPKLVFVPKTDQSDWRGTVRVPNERVIDLQSDASGMKLSTSYDKRADESVISIAVVKGADIPSRTHISFRCEDRPSKWYKIPVFAKN